jgi:hypothetical protein
VREPVSTHGRIQEFDELRQMNFDFVGQYMQIFDEYDNYIRVIHGQGRIEWDNGEYYIGDFYNSMIHGSGQMKGIDSSNNGFVYEGDFYNDLKHGFGTIIWDNDSSYTGEWKRGKRHGEGRFMQSENSYTVMFTGMWYNDEIVPGSGTWVKYELRNGG